MQFNFTQFPTFTKIICIYFHSSIQLFLNACRWHCWSFQSKCFSLNTRKKTPPRKIITRYLPSEKFFTHRMSNGYWSLEICAFILSSQTRFSLWTLYGCLTHSHAIYQLHLCVCVCVRSGTQAMTYTRIHVIHTQLTHTVVSWVNGYSLTIVVTEFVSFAQMLIPTVQLMWVAFENVYMRFSNCSQYSISFSIHWTTK